MPEETKPENGGQQLALVSTANGPLAFLTDTAAFNHLWRVASAYAESSIVPQHVRGKKADCFILCQMAIRMDVDPFMLMQNCYVVHGKPGFLAQFAVARLNSSGKIRGVLKYDRGGEGDKYGYTAWAIDADTGERVDGPRVDWAMVKAEQWLGKDGSKWKTMPEVMFRYRAAAFFVRTNYPEVLLGMQTVEEIADSVLDVEAFDAEAERETLADRLKVQAEAARPEQTGTQSLHGAVHEQAATPEPKKRGRPPKVVPPAAEPAHVPTPDPTGAGVARTVPAVLPGQKTLLPDPAVPVAAPTSDPDLDVLTQWREAIKLASLTTIDEYRTEASKQYANDEMSGPVHAALMADITNRKLALEGEHAGKKSSRGERSQNPS